MRIHFVNVDVKNKLKIIKLFSLLESIIFTKISKYDSLCLEICFQSDSFECDIMDFENSLRFIEW
jgi:hypothetical protein